MIEIIALSYCSNPGIVTEADCLEAASAAALAAAGPVVFDWSEGPTDGIWQLDRTVILHGNEATIHPGQIVLTASMDVGLEIRAHSAVFTAPIRVRGTGSTIYTQRTVTDLVHLANVAYTQFAGFDVANALGDCIRTGASSGTPSIVSTDFGLVKARDCGSSAYPGNASRLELDWLSVTNTGTWGSVAQRAQLEIDGSADAIAVGDLVYLEDVPHYVYSVVAGANDVLHLFPQYEGSATSGTVMSAHGAGIRLTGGNTTGHRGMLDCQRVGVCLADAGLYGGTWSIVAEASGVGVQLGASPEGAHLRGALTGHFELGAGRRSGIKVQRSAVVGLTIGSLLETPLQGCNWQGLTPDGSNAWRSFAGATFLHGGAAIDGDLVWCVP